MKRTNTRDEAQAAKAAVFPELVTPRKAAALLRLSVRTLDGYRLEGGGPAFFAFGRRIAYARADLAAWAAVRRFRHTAGADAL